MIKTIPVILFIGLLGTAIGMDLQYEKHHKHSRSNEALMENGEDHHLWDYMRLRDPATGEIPRGIHIRELEFAKNIGTYRPALKGTPTIHSTGWNSAGPINAGGRTRAIGIDIANEANVLIATAQGGIFRSTDSGESWFRTTSPGELKNMTSLVQDHRKGKTGIWYAGTGELFSTTWRRTSVYTDIYSHSADIGNGIYKSTDDGQSWSVLPSTVDASATTLDSVFDGVWDIALDSSNLNRDIVYAAGYGAIMRSADGGDSWTRVLGDPVNISYATDVAITSNGVLYACLSAAASGTDVPSTAGVWRSTDGIQWVRITPSGWPPQSGRIKIAVAPSDPSVVYFGGVAPNLGYGVAFFKYTYISGDGAGSGGKWEDRSANVPKPSGPIVSDGLNTYGGYAIALKVHPSDANIVFFGGTNLYRSFDGFATTDKMNWIGGYNPVDGSYGEEKNDHPDHHALEFLPSNPTKAFCGNDGGMFMTYNALGYDDPNFPVVWKNINFMDQASILYVVGIDHATPGDTTIIGGFQDQGSWLSVAPNNIWEQYDYGDGCYCAIADKKSAYYMSSQNGYIDRWILEPDFSYDSAYSIRPMFGTPQFVAPWLLDPANTDRMYFSAGNTLWRNNDLSGDAVSNWVQLPNVTLPATSLITAFGMSYQAGHRLYYGTSDGHVFRIDEADVGLPAPNEITGSIFPKNAFVSCIAVDPQNADSIVVCFSNYHVISIFASNDGGKTWRNASGNLEQNTDGSGDGPSVRWVSIVHQNGQGLYLCGTSVGLFSTTDISNNVTWIPEGLQTIGRAIVENIDARQSDGFIAIATQGSGVFSTHVAADPSIVGAHGNAPNSNAPPPSFTFTISPNPASQRATVSFSLPAQANVKLSVIDMTGKTILHSLDGTEWPSGPANVTLDCSRLPTGSYFVELRIDEAVETKRLVIER